MRLFVLIQLYMIIYFFHQQVADLHFAELVFVFIQQNGYGLVGAGQVMKKISQESFVIEFAMLGQFIVFAGLQGTVQLEKMPVGKQAVQVVVIGSLDMCTYRNKN